MDEEEDHKDCSREVVSGLEELVVPISTTDEARGQLDAVVDSDNKNVIELLTESKE